MPKVEGNAELNGLLETVYSKCIKDGGTESSCSAIAWEAAENAGWKKVGDKWEKAVDAMETAEMSGVEILRSGKWKPANWGGRVWEIKPEDVDSIKDQTEKYLKSTGNRPYMKLDHGVDNSTLLNYLKSVSLGTVKRLYTEVRDGAKTLLADFTGIPQKFHDLIRNGLASKRSVEIRSRDGYGQVLDAVAFFGSGNPAVAGMNELATELFAMRESDANAPALPGDSGTVIVLTENQDTTSDGVHNMDEKMETLIAENAALKAKIEQMETGVKSDTEMKSVKDQYEIKLKEIENEKSKIETQLKEATEKLEAVALLKEKERVEKVSKFIEARIADGKLAPANKEKIEAIFAAFGDDEDLIQAQMDLMSSAPETGLFKESAKSTGTGGKVDRKDPELDSKCKAWLKENKLEDNLVNYKAALKELTGYEG